MNLGRIKSRLVRILAACGGYPLARWLTRNQPKILMYHRFSEAPSPGCVDRQSWRQQLAYFKRHHQVMNLGQFVDCLERGKVPPNTLVLTVDDGYRDFYTIGFDELQRAGLSATLFVTTGFVDHRLWLWPDRLAWVLDQLPPGKTAIRVASLAQDFMLPEERPRLAATLKALLVPLPLTQKYELIEALASHHQISLTANAPAGFEPCSWDELRHMQAQGIEIGGHSVNHPILKAESDAQVVVEIHGCKQRLDAELSQPVVSFCYPNGEAADYDERAKLACAQAGFASSVAAHHDHLHFADRYDLPRYAGSHDLFHVAKVASGVDLLGRRLARWWST